MSCKLRIRMLILDSPLETAKSLAARSRAKRLELGLKQSTLSARSGVSVSTIKRFESTGTITLDNLIKLSNVLGSTEILLQMFPARKIESIKDLEDQLAESRPRYGRI